MLINNDSVMKEVQLEPEINTISKSMDKTPIPNEIQKLCFMLNQKERDLD